jgi:curli biogenesis system outer membrane secretion channel CsgG
MMFRKNCAAIAAALALALPALAAPQSASAASARDRQEAGQDQIPQCTRNLGYISIVEPDDKWWRQYSLGSPEAILRVFVQRSGCFTLVNRGRAMMSREMERALAESGELRSGSNMGAGQVVAADYLLQPDIVSANSNAGGGGGGGGLLGRALGGILGSTAGRIAGGISVKKGEANVTLSIVNTRTTVEEALTEGYASKKDTNFNASAALWGGGNSGSLGLGGYENTKIGQIIVLAYLDAYTDMVYQLGGMTPP